MTKGRMLVKPHIFSSGYVRLGESEQGGLVLQISTHDNTMIFQQFKYEARVDVTEIKTLL